MNLKIAVLGSEKTIFGFKIAGFSNNENLFLIFDDEANEEELLNSLQEILNRTDIGLVFISENLFNLCSSKLEKHDRLFPSILKIPTWQ